MGKSTIEDKRKFVHLAQEIFLFIINFLEQILGHKGGIFYLQKWVDTKLILHK